VQGQRLILTGGHGKSTAMEAAGTEYFFIVAAFISDQVALLYWFLIRQQLRMKKLSNCREVPKK
jgi:hypothetical protein